MEEKIKNLKVIATNIHVLAMILAGELKKEDLEDSGTIAEQITLYKYEGDNFTCLIKEIIEEHGSEECPYKEV